MKGRFRTIAAAALLIHFSTVPARADDCKGVILDVPIEAGEATADAWPNMRNAQGSLKFESNRMLTGAAKQISSAKAPADFACPAGCKPADKPTIQYQTIPNKYRSDYSDEAKCKKLLEQTKKVPIEYKDRKFDSIDSLASWYGDFSQGSGGDGADLYAKCDGDCSPQYRTTIRAEKSGYSLDASVICGEARDKSDNKYKLSSALRWSCLPAGS